MGGYSTTKAWQVKNEKAVLHKNLNSTYACYETLGKDFFCWTPSSKTKYSVTKAKPFDSAESSAMKKHNLILVTAYKQHGPPEMRHWLFHATFPFAKAAGNTNTVGKCCFVMQTWCLRVVFNIISKLSSIWCNIFTARRGCSLAGEKSHTLLFMGKKWFQSKMTRCTRSTFVVHWEKCEEVFCARLYFGTCTHTFCVM